MEGEGLLAETARWLDRAADVMDAAVQGHLGWRPGVTASELARERDRIRSFLKCLREAAAGAASGGAGEPPRPEEARWEDDGGVPG